ncbi:MAG: ABC transporter permease [Pseudoxanthomonas sp.]
MSNLFRDLAESFKRPDHWLYSSWLGVITKYRKTYLGLFWIFVPPMVYIWGIGWFVGMINPVNVRPFMAHVGVGFIAFRLLTSVMNDSTVVFAQYQTYINDGNLRLTDYLLGVLARALIYFVLAMPVLLVAMLMSANFEPAGIPGSFLGLLVVVINLFFYSVILGLLGARFPDASEVIGSATLFLFLVTPIVWYPTAAPAGTLHGMLMRVNPFHHLIAAIRAPLTDEVLEPLTYYYLAGMTVVGLVVAVVAYRKYARRVPIWI